MTGRGLGLVVASISLALLVACGAVFEEGDARKVDKGEDDVSSQGPQDGTQAAQSLTCPGGQQPGYFEAFVGGDAPGGPADPVGAVIQTFARENMLFAREQFDVAAADDQAAQVVGEVAGTRQFTAYVEKVGDSWYVTEFFACAAWLEKGREQ